MPKTKIRTNGKRFFFCPNAHIRIKVWNYRDHICFSCQKKKRLEKSAIFFSDDCKTHFSDKTNRWILDLNDYIWLCRDCMSLQEPIKRLEMAIHDWQKSQSFSYQFSET